MAFPELIVTALSNPDRPLNNLILFLQERLVGLNPDVALLLVFLSSTFLIVVVYYLFFGLFENRSLALFGALFYLLLPNKLELYHTAIYVNINLVFSLYALSFILFVRFMKARKRVSLLLSIAGYTAAVFWYEVGFFLPVVLFTYATVYDKQRRKAALWFLIPAFVYVLFRTRGGLALSAGPMGVRGIEGLPTIFYNMFMMVPNHYVGRYMMRAIVYGVYKFPSIELPWIVIVTLMDVIIVYVFVLWLKKQVVPAIDVRLISIAGIMFATFLVPNALYIVEGRHTALSSIGFIMVCVALIRYLGHRWKVISSMAFASCLIISQGTAWSQVIACRINNAVFESVAERKAEIVKSDRVLIDTRSFADRIPYTWGERQMNLLNAYYGAQAFAPWGLSAMVRLLAGERTPVYIGRSRPEETGNQLTFQVQVKGPLHRTETIPKWGTVVIDYEGVYGGEFRNGNRVKNKSQGG